MNRLRVQATVDGDAVSPDSIRAAAIYLTSQLEERAAAELVALDWNTFHAYTWRKRNGDIVFVQWVKVIKS